jgi:pimeloyl-ACP methyl ester carboxylesterase
MPFVELPARKIETYFEEYGTGDPVVLIGGLTSTTSSWQCQFGPLSARYRVIAPDNRGSGRTRLIDDDGLRSPQIWADDVLALLDALALDRVHLVGMSMGGFVAQAFAASYEARLRSLALLCTAPGGDRGTPVDPEALRGVVGGAAPDATADDLDALGAAVLDPDTRRLRPEAWEMLIETRRTSPHTGEEIERRTRGLGTLNAWDALGRLTVPTLVMTGASDRLVAPENSRRIAQQIPGAELRLVDGGGHMFFMEQPDATNDALLDLFARS